MLVLALSPERVEAALAAGEIACPQCAGQLTPRGYARSRQIRLREDRVCTLTPRRAQCRSCARTHVLCPAWTVLRRRDGSEVIGEALAMAAGGLGHRRIADRLGRPQGTVRGWLRAARSGAEQLRACATRWLVALDPEPAAIAPTGRELGDAVEAMMLAVRAWVLRFATDELGPWERAGWLTGGLLGGPSP
jgi:hypothetical protein